MHRCFVCFKIGDWQRRGKAHICEPCNQEYYAKFGISKSKPLTDKEAKRIMRVNKFDEQNREPEMPAMLDSDYHWFWDWSPLPEVKGHCNMRAWSIRNFSMCSLAIVVTLTQLMFDVKFFGDD